MAQNANLNKQPIGYIRQVVKVNSEDLSLVYTDSGILHMFVSDITRDQTITLPEPDIAGQEFEFFWIEDQTNGGNPVLNRIFKTPAGSSFKGTLFHQHDGANQMNSHHPNPGDTTLKIHGTIANHHVKSGSKISFFSDGSSWIVFGFLVAHDNASIVFS